MVLRTGSLDRIVFSVYNSEKHKMSSFGNIFYMEKLKSASR
jgi:hypothetical protein